MTCLQEYLHPAVPSCTLPRIPASQTAGTSDVSSASVTKSSGTLHATVCCKACRISGPTIVCWPPAATSAAGPHVTGRPRTSTTHVRTIISTTSTSESVPRVLSWLSASAGPRRRRPRRQYHKLTSTRDFVIIPNPKKTSKCMAMH
jgi:hypothetical protein